jgi:hypothetical protein
MAVLTLNVIDGMGACAIICRFLLVASIATHWLRFFCFFMGSEIRNIPVTAVARIGPMDRLGKLPFVDLIPMAPETFRVVHALIAVFPALDNEFLHFFCRLRRLGHLCGLGVLFPKNRFYCQQKSQVQDENSRDGEIDKDGSFKVRSHSPPCNKSVHLIKINKKFFLDLMKGEWDFLTQWKIEVNNI